MFGLFGLVAFIGGLLGVLAFFKFLSESGRSQRLSARIDVLEERQRHILKEMERLAARTGAARDAEGAATAGKTAPFPSRSPSPRPTMEDAEAPAGTPWPASLEGAASDAMPVPAPGREAPSARRSGRDVGLEERLGTRWAVWVGGVALALGALLLVRYSIEQGIFGPEVRLMLGALLAAALIGAGEWLRRSEVRLGIIGAPSAHIPGVLTAAGTVAAFGTIYAAHAVYGFLGSGAAFFGLGVVGLATMLAAGLHGPALAGLGLAGSFLTPALVSSAEPSPWPLVIYLAVAATGAYGLGAWRQWGWLALSAAVGGMAWGVLLSAEASDLTIWIGPVMAHGLLQLAIAAAILVLLKSDEDAQSGSRIDIPATISLAILAGLAAIILAANDGVSPASLAFTATAITMLALSGLRQAAVAPSIVAAGALVVAKMMIWPSAAGSRVDPSWGLPPETAAGPMFTVPLETSWFVAFALVAALAVAGVAAARLWLSPRLDVTKAAWFVVTAALLPLSAHVVGYLRITGYEPSLMFALAGLGLAGLFTAAALVFEARETDAATPAIRLGTGAMAAAAVAASALALIVYLDRGYLTVALAVAAFATAVMADIKGISALRTAVVALGLVVLARVVYDPRIMGDSVGAMPILNWLLLGYGVPAVSFFGAARVLERSVEDKASRLCWALAIIFAALLAFFEIRHLVNDGDVLARRTDHVELGLMLIVSLAFAYALMRSGVGQESLVFRTASMAFGGLSAAITVLGLFIVHNPALTDEPIRSYGPLSSLMLAYLVPALGAALLARHARGRWPEPLYYAAGVLAMVLVFAFITLEVRHAYQGGAIGLMRETSQAEYYSYSVAWLLLGVAMLAYGLWRGMPEARLASAALVVLTVLKVFLWDLSGLEGPWRAFSFIGLGVVLVGIGLVYQRLVFTHRQPGLGEER